MAQPSEAQPAPAAGRRHLDQLVGAWDARVQVFQGPEGPPSESSGRMVNEWVLGGRYLQQRYEGRAADQAMNGLGYWGYNDGAGLYEYVWMDTMSTVMMTGRGGPSADGRLFTTTGAVRTPAGELRHRSVLTVKGPDEHVYEIFFTGPDGNEFRSLHITYTRTGRS